MPDSAGRAAVASARRASEQQRAGHAAEADAGGDPVGAQRRVYAASRPPAGLAGQPRQRARSARGAAVAGVAAKQRFAQRGQRPDGRRRAKSLGRVLLAAPQRPYRSRHPRPPAKRRKRAGAVDFISALFSLFRRQRQRAAKRSPDADARLAARSGAKWPEAAADGRLAGHTG